MKDQKGLFLSLIGVALFIVAVGMITKKQIPTSLPNLKKITIGNTAVMVNIANTPQTRQKGLSGVTGMPQNQGMLFVFDSKNLTPEMARFWMKDMLIPLDFIWISKGQVVEITPNVPAPAVNTPDSQLIIYQPNENVDYVLEVNAGFAGKKNINVGDSVTLSL